MAKVEIRVPVVVVETGQPGSAPFDPYGSLVRMQGMTDKELAGTLEDAERKGDVSTASFALNEIVVRLDLPRDEAEQGLTPAAAEAVDEWVAKANPTTRKERRRP